MKVYPGPMLSCLICRRRYTLGYRNSHFKKLEELDPTGLFCNSKCAITYAVRVASGGKTDEYYSTAVFGTKLSITPRRIS